jgi:hypothetical protein
VEAPKSRGASPLREQNKGTEESSSSVVDANTLPSGERSLDERLNKISAKLENSGMGEIPRIFAAKLETLRKNMTYSTKTTDEVGIFSTFKSDVGESVMILPRNFSELLENPVWGPLLAFLLNDFPGNFKMSEKDDLVVHAYTDRDRLFWLGYINRMQVGIPASGLNFNVQARYPQEAGRACADCEIFINHKMVDGTYYKYLPNTVRTDSGGKVLNAELLTLVGMKQRHVVDRLSKLLTKIAKTKVVNVDDKIIDAIKISVALLTPAIVRTHRVKKTIDRKVVEKTVPIHYNRPSKIVESIRDEESAFLKELEAPWDELKALHEQYLGGVAVKDIPEFLKRYKTSYERQVDVTSKLAGWRARRRLAMSDFLPKGKQARKFKETDRNEFIAWICVSKSKNTPDFSSEVIGTFNIMKLRNAFGLNVDSEVSAHLEPARLVRDGSVLQSVKYLPKDKQQLYLRSLSWIDPESDLGHFIGLRELFLKRKELEEKKEDPAAL